MAAKCLDAAFHMPKIGSGLGGGNWNQIEQAIKEICIDQAIPVFVYEL